MASTTYRKSLSVAAGLVATGISCGVAQAQQVVLRAKGGDFEFSGRLKSKASAAFVIETSAGEITLDAAQFDCTGDGCPAVRLQKSCRLGSVSPSTGRARSARL